MNILIRGGLLIDPANSINSKQDIYISHGKIVASSESFVPDEIIDAAGKVVCPGFIDIHMHEDPIEPDGRLYKHPEKAIFNCMLRQGVTTAIGGNCGENKYHPADYLDIVDSQGAAVNVGMMAGHEYLRHMVGAMDKYAPISEDKLQRMSAEAESCLIRGCVGVSFGIRYIPGMDMHELLKTAEGCKRHGGRISAHIRSDAEEVFDSAREFLDAGLELNVPVQLSHIGSMAGFGQMERFLQLVDSYRLIKPEIGCDCYPYDAFSTGLGSTTYDEGWMERYGCDYSVVELAEGKYKGQRCTKEIFDELRRDHPECMTICYVMQQEEVDRAFMHPGVMLGSDGTLSEGQGHPRAAGAFPRFFARYVKTGRLSLYEAISRITAVPAKQLALSHKGRLNVGADADIVILDPERIEDRATFSEPLLPPVGIDYVIVNGVIAAKDNKILSFDSGRSIRKQ